MISDKSTSPTPAIKQQKQANNGVMKSKLSQTNSNKKQQPQTKKKSFISKPQVVNEVSKQPSSRTNGNLSDSYANITTKEERKESAKSDSIATSKGTKDIPAKYTSTRYVFYYNLPLIIPA
ncbi:hypothetical protein LOD99_13034 [Oopsacas minuta]|uniref:Uncharacterized protein n=1 Tax=Oopsacas minuta TaxID=111878 RepID=A0AAV7JAS5_9METZ|nr:hypothetical protein LOD99_13034 [Oopsacas minuta]